MDALTLTDQEQILYGDLFLSCDIDSAGKITGVKAYDLFRSAGLSHEVLLQITELCGAKRLGHFGRSQFYIALKLIAAAQSGLPTKLDSLNSGMEIPLPMLTKPADQDPSLQHIQPEPYVTKWIGSQLNKWRGQQSAPHFNLLAGDPETTNIPDRPVTGQLPPPPKKAHVKNLSGQYRYLTIDGSSQQPSTQQNNAREDSPSDTRSPPFSPKESPPSSPVDKRLATIGKQKTAPALLTSAPTAVSGSLPSNSLPGSAPQSAPTSGGYPNADGGWAFFEDDENHGLLGTGTKDTFDNMVRQVDSSSLSSEAESTDDVWSISEEQRDYYFDQFKKIQPDVNGVILGRVAKEFFEKSKLPVHELSKIWQLSDLNKDGALSLDEFCIAMHLVVLRRNEIELPDRLPLSLMPYAVLTNGESTSNLGLVLNTATGPEDEPFAADLPPGSTLKRATPTGQWVTTFPPESPTSSGVSSPGLKPVNFEFSQPVASDPDSKIVQPLAMRVSPDVLPVSPEERSRTLSDPAAYEWPVDSQPPELSSPTKQRANTESNLDLNQNDSSLQGKFNTPLHGRPRPKKAPDERFHRSMAPSATPGQGQLIQPPPANQVTGCDPGSADKLPGTAVDGSPLQGPPPPPRPEKVHGRSLSVDFRINTSLMTAPPAVPPRVSPKDVPKKSSGEFGAIDLEKISKFADYKRFESIPSQEVLNVTTNDSREPLENNNIADKHKRSMSLDYKQPGISGSPLIVDIGDPGGGTVSDGNEDDASELPNSDVHADETDSAPMDKAKIISSALLSQLSRDQRDLQLGLRTHKERNSTLSRLNSELNQELQEVMEQRIALEIQLEHLRPFSS